jgi:hypothetical protein
MTTYLSEHLTVQTVNTWLRYSLAAEHKTSVQMIMNSVAVNNLTTINLSLNISLFCLYNTIDLPRWYTVKGLASYSWDFPFKFPLETAYLNYVFT